ncbi:unnamed protein product [Rodentolepis nana]|uniref:PABC domain-containing protein n=1 Tax=Rodentolepis nana TaxID=102285 RepID=A0A0R3TI04_RODNA|nr:unnamed protein product [Rodentolepis nana]
MAGHPVGCSRIEDISPLRAYLPDQCACASAYLQADSHGVLVDSRFHCQADAHNLTLNSASVFAGHHCETQLSDMFGRMLGTTGSGSLQNLSVSAPFSQPNMLQNMLALANSPHNVGTVLYHGSSIIGLPVGVGKNVVTGGQASGSSAGGTESGVENKHLTSDERQAYGNILYQKIVKSEPTLASKITGMILKLNPSFVLKVVISDAVLEKAV